MNPFSKHKKRYITACFLVAVIYAFVAGFNQTVIFRIINGTGFGILLFATGIVLWIIFRFAIPANCSHKYRIIFVLILTFLTSSIISGIEMLVVYLCFPSSFDSYAPTIPVRAFIALLICVILYLLYEFIEKKRFSSESISSKKPIDSLLISELKQNEATNHANPATTQMIDRLTVRTGQKIKIIPIDNILYIKAEGDYIGIRTAEGSWLKEQTMKYTEDRLPLNDFVRIHRSFIVNIHKINRIERYGEKQQVVLSNNEKIKISAARYQTLKLILGI